MKYKKFGICVYLRHNIEKCRLLYIHGATCTNINSDLPLFHSFGVNTSDIYKTMLNVTIIVRTIVTLTEAMVSFSMPKINTSVC